MTTPAVIGSMKRVIPAPLKRAARAAWLDRRFRRAVGQLLNSPPVMPSRDTLNELITCWDNEGFAAQLDYLEEVCRQAINTEGPILECGSGLTSVLLGLLAGRRGVETWSLEHFPAWLSRVEGSIQRLQIPNVRICSAPLHSFDGFDWYLPPDQMPNEFRLVICDGPPGNTKGGRYGLMPVMRARLARECVILLDDAARPGEVEVMQRWSAETNFKVTSSPDQPYAVMARE